MTLRYDARSGQPLVKDMGDRVLYRYLTAALANISEVMRGWENTIDDYDSLSTGLPGLISRLNDPTADPDQKRRDLRLSYRYITFPEVYFELCKLKGLNVLFLAILQQYDLNPKDQRFISKLAQFYSKSRALKFKDFPTAATKFPELWSTIKTQLATTQDILGRSKLHSSEADGHKVMTAGPFKLINTGNFSKEVMTTVGKLAEEAARLLGSKGLSKVCYGDIMISSQVDRKKSILAFYLPSKDEMFVRADLKGHESEALATFLHELAHRLQSKFLSGQKNRDINLMFRRIQDGSEGAKREALQKLLEDPATTPKVGDTIVDPRTDTELTFYKLEYKRGEPWAILLVKGEEDSVRNRLGLPLYGYYQYRGISLDLAKIGGFVTGYASTDPDENFAEMIAAYCLGKLHPSQVEMLEEIIR